jgi:N-acetylneuraminate synthase
MSDWKEIDDAVTVLAGKVALTVMQCTSIYPCPIEKVGLNVIHEVQDRYGDAVTVGLSDHSMSIFTGAAAVMAGAKVIEKHLTFSRRMYGSDAANALEPQEFDLYCKGVETARKLLDNPVTKDLVDDFVEMREIFQKSIVYQRALQAGTKITMADLAFKKPGTGVPANQYRDYLGQILAKDVTKDAFLMESDFKNLI